MIEKTIRSQDRFLQSRELLRGNPTRLSDQSGKIPRKLEEAVNTLIQRMTYPCC